MCVVALQRRRLQESVIRSTASSGACTYNKLFHVPFQAHIGKVWHHVCDHLEPSIFRALERFADGAHRVATASQITPQRLAILRRKGLTYYAAKGSRMNTSHHHHHHRRSTTLRHLGIVGVQTGGGPVGRQEAIQSAKATSQWDKRRTGRQLDSWA